MRLVKGANDLATVNPTLAEEWNYEKNGTLTPDQVTAGSHKKVWWKCEFGHEWETKVYHRGRSGSGCPICFAERKTSFAEQAIAFYLSKILTVKQRWTGMGKEIDIYLPEIRVGIEYNGLYWHKEKNDKDEKKKDFFKRRNVKIITVFESLENKVGEDFVEHNYRDKTSLNWAVAEIGRLLSLNIEDIDIQRDNVEILNRYVLLKKEESIQIKNSTLAEEWNYEKNGSLTPDMVTAGSHKKVWWKCKHGHEWEAIISNRAKGSGCPICSGYTVLKGFNDLATVNSTLAEEWNYEKNGTLTPDQVTIGYDKKVWWKCKFGHEWEADISSRKRGRGCPFCSGNVVLKGFNDLATVNSTLAEEWNYEKNGSLTPDMVTQRSGKKVWWKCKYGHEWEVVVAKRSEGNGCPVCSNKKVLKGYNDLLTVNPTLAEEWNYDKNGTLTPDMVTAGSSKKVWWKCDKGHEWEATVKNRSHGRGCPYCSGRRKS